MSELQKIEKDIDLTLNCIRHWIANSLLEEVNISAKSCALCEEYHGDDCEGCPICEKTGEEVCKNTPYWELVQHPVYNNERINREKLNKTNSKELFCEFSLKEVLFLSELLNDLIKKRDELKENEKSNFKVGDYVKIKKGLAIHDVIFSWPGDDDFGASEEIFPDTIFKVVYIEKNNFNAMGYHSYVSSQKVKSKWKFSITQFDKIEPPIPECGDLVVDLNDYYKYKLQLETIEKDGIKYLIGEDVNDKELKLLKEDEIQVIVKNKIED